ncbi:MAG: hypothetical protein D6746_03210 [Bacteroidetes bacterium]|nr:MAG: hypothetical protein D6746_03210 [Bacteroidota bacterium]
MRLTDLQCRICRERYHLEDVGCDICKPAKRNLIVPEEDLSDLESSVAHSMRVLQELTYRLETAMHKGYGRRGTKIIDESHVRMAKTIASGVALLAGEQRKIYRDRQNQLRNLSLEKRLELFLEWLVDLPQEYRQMALERVVAALKGEQPAALAAPEERKPVVVGDAPGDK